MWRMITNTLEMGHVNPTPPIVIENCFISFVDVIISKCVFDNIHDHARLPVCDGEF